MCPTDDNIVGIQSFIELVLLNLPFPLSSFLLPLYFSIGMDLILIDYFFSDIAVRRVRWRTVV